MYSKTAAILGLLLTTLVGCAHVPSEYNQGCRDGVMDFVENGLNALIVEGIVEKRCDSLDAAHSTKKEIRERR